VQANRRAAQADERRARELKHMGDGPERRVVLRARRHARAVGVEVVDTGPECRRS